MRIEIFKYENVKPDGEFGDELGQVGVLGGFTISEEEGGCNIGGCQSCSKCHWISISQPRTEDGTVEGRTIYFNNKEEKNKFIYDAFNSHIMNIF